MWEQWASDLHEGKEGQEPILNDPREAEDYQFVKEVYTNKEKVSQVLEFSTSESAWERIMYQINPFLRIRIYLKYAAVIAVTVLISGAAFWYYGNSMLGNNQYAVVTAPNGQICNITLFDSTNVWLNAGSSIKYRNSFNKNDREVYLEGEALFSVKKSKKVPFVVHAGNTKVRVFGTQFNVKAYKNEGSVEAVLLEGEIQFSSGKKKVLMEPGERLLYANSTGNMSVTDVDAEEYTTWKGGKIYYSNETLSLLTNQLERWYEVNFIYHDESLKNYRFTGVINKERSLEYTLKVIQEINKVEFKIIGEKVMVKDKL